MKKALSIIAFIFFLCQSLIGQENLFARIADNYFRANPFDREYSKFLQFFMNDPTIINKKIVKKTDSTFFSFTAEYKNHSPFSFVADRTEIRLMEKEMEFGDSISVIDTVFIYQLLGYKYGKGGEEEVKKEFNKFNRRFKNDFYTDQHSDILKNEEVVGGVINYFVLFADVSPISISWAKADDFQSFFSIVFRFKLRQNLAVLPIPSDGR